MSQGTSGGDLGVYVHVPFCEHVCPYCDFAVVAVGRLGAPDEDAWVELVLREWERWRDRLAGRRVASVYFGGGTPSLVAAKSLERVLAALGAALRFDSPEITVEANPENLDDARLAAWRAAGVTRLSIGVQSFDDAELARLGRVHDARAAPLGVARARAAGFDDLSLDLMYAFPGNDAARFGQSLARALALEPSHVSAYAYTAESGTPMGDAVRKGRLARPDDDAEAALFDLAHETLAAAGYRHYEISNFARADRATRHHLQYWRRGDYLGLGPSAVSFLDGRRVRAPRGLVEWARGIEDGDAPRGWGVDDARPHALFEAAFLGLRLDAGMRFGRRGAARPMSTLARREPGSRPRVSRSDGRRSACPRRSGRAPTRSCCAGATPPRRSAILRPHEPAPPRARPAAPSAASRRLDPAPAPGARAARAPLPGAGAAGGVAIAGDGRPARLGAATLRQTMLELEDLGLLEQPHAAAGVPSDRGLRLFVDGLDEARAAVRPRARGGRGRARAVGARRRGTCSRRPRACSPSWRRNSRSPCGRTWATGSCRGSSW